MKFHLNFSPQKPNYSIEHKHTLFLIGSCFSNNIGDYLINHEFNTLVNPTGILFNPLSICDYLTNLIHQKDSLQNLILQRDLTFYSYQHHSSVNSTTKEKLLKKVKKINLSTLEFIKSSDFIFITFGTAYYYYHTGLQTVVANCHKQANTQFDKKRLSVEEIVSSYSELISEIRKLNSRVKIIFTVSPVKHLKDGLIENSVSKSILLLATHQLVETQPDCYYFPAYELVNDDLRDYRFYKEDLAHPNDLAIRYVWEKFSYNFFNEKTVSANEKITKLNQILTHRPIHQTMETSNLYEKKITELKAKIANDLKQ